MLETPPTPDPSPPLYERGEGNPEAGANTHEGDSLYFSVNSDEAAAAVDDTGREGLYFPVNSGASGEGPPRLNPE